ncbi:MAG TPA: TadE/TadG family type IV pilus assembly protein [Rhizomicrobium sp.]|nr:TadE/TadG family type IV pilus assembly protein [Rhizomicrobium sp.]
MLRKLFSFARARDGLAAVEFALIAPVMVTFFLGAIELTDAMGCNSRVVNLASTASDLVAQETQISNAGIANVYSALNSIVYPYPTTNIEIVITSVVDDGHGGGKVAWSDAQNTTARAVNSAVVVPTGVIPTGGSAILAEVTYPYTSPLSDFIVGPVNMTSQFYERPRRSATVARVP